MWLGNLQKIMKVILVPVPIFGNDIFINLSGCLAFCFLQCELASSTLFQNHQNKRKTRIKLKELVDTFPTEKDKIFSVWSRERAVHSFTWFLIFMFPIFHFFAVWGMFCFPSMPCRVAGERTGDKYWVHWRWQMPLNRIRAKSFEPALKNTTE